MRPTGANPLDPWKNSMPRSCHSSRACSAHLSRYGRGDHSPPAPLARSSTTYSQWDLIPKSQLEFPLPEIRQARPLPTTNTYGARSFAALPWVGVWGRTGSSGYAGKAQIVHDIYHSLFGETLLLNRVTLFTVSSASDCTALTWQQNTMLPCFNIFQRSIFLCHWKTHENTCFCQIKCGVDVFWNFLFFPDA